MTKEELKTKLMNLGFKEVFFKEFDDLGLNDYSEFSEEDFNYWKYEENSLILVYIYDDGTPVCIADFGGYLSMYLNGKSYHDEKTIEFSSYDEIWEYIKNE